MLRKGRSRRGDVQPVLRGEQREHDAGAPHRGGDGEGQLDAAARTSSGIVRAAIVPPSGTAVWRTPSAQPRRDAG